MVFFWRITYPATLALCQACGQLWTTLESPTGPRSNGAPLKISATWSTSTCLAASGPLLHFCLWSAPPKVSSKFTYISLSSHSYWSDFKGVSLCYRSDGLHVKHLFLLHLPERGSIQCVKERTGGVRRLPEGWNGQLWSEGAVTLLLCAAFFNLNNYWM